MKRTNRGIYVETLVNAPLERVWALTQDPAQHARWDLRFGRIEPQASEKGARRFTYSTFGVSGTGVHVGDRWRETGGATSSLRFASPHVLSPIAEGAGYWRYEPQAGALRFLTGYDYRARYRRIDRVFRPLMGWATAWSFDRLRLWAERDQSPARSA
uniref:SRPBCC family protein n=1 Tax=uncultured Aeromicrobium sp. TaxID=337820 RepID=UPI003447A0FF